MARLSSEDEDVKSSFELVFILDSLKKKESISWIPYRLELETGEKLLTFDSGNNPSGAGDYVLALQPINEIDNLIQGINSFLSNKVSGIFSFEPVEPSFELVFEKGHKGISFTVWVDSGNVISDHYTWDAFGLRFFTKEENIKKFVSQLLAEKEKLYSDA